jgi:hypothetical protein
MMFTAVRSQVVHLNEVLGNAVADMRTGRTSWRVMLVLAIPAFAAGIAAGLTRLS